jgi:ankyrin repeat protein
MEAVSSGHNNLIAPLLSYKANPELKDDGGRTAADIASQKSNDEAVVLLARH